MRDELVRIAQESASASAFEANVLAFLQKEVGCDAAFFLTDGQPATPVGLQPNFAELLVARGAVYASELTPVKQAALAARGVAVDTEVCGVRHVRRAQYFREVVSKVGGQHSLMAYVPWNGRILAAVMLGRREQAFAQHDVQRIEALLPTLGVARAAFGLPHPVDPSPLPPAKARNWFGIGRSSQVLATLACESGTLAVRDRNGFREMVAQDGASELIWTRAALHNSSKSGWPYADLFHVASALARHRRRALFVGSGGAVSVHQFARVYPGIAIDLVELEPAVIELARSWFSLDAIPRLTVHVTDGASFIHHAHARTWDIVVIDAYDASDCSPAYLERTFLVALHRALQPGGAVAFNIIGALRGPGPVTALVNAASAIFEDVRIVPVISPNETYAEDTLRNVVVVVTRGE